MLTFSLVLMACGEKPARFTQESFSIDSPYKSRLESNSTVACESARRVLLGDGYIIGTYIKDNIKGRKAYLADSDRSTFIEMNVVCVDEQGGSMVYANGLLSNYDVKRSSSSASVGVSALGSLSLPFGQSADSMVKTSDETIRDREFYRRFFNAMNIVMARIKKAEENAVQQTEITLTGEQNQGKSNQGDDTQTTSQNSDPVESAAATELPPTPQVEPARTAEALEEAQQKLLESPAPSTTSKQSVDKKPAAATPTTIIELAQPTINKTPKLEPEEATVSNPEPVDSTLTDTVPEPVESTVTVPTAKTPKLENQPEIINPTE